MSGGGNWLRLIPYVLEKILIGYGSNLESFLRIQAFVLHKRAVFAHCFSVKFFWILFLLLRLQFALGDPQATSFLSV